MNRSGNSGSNPSKSRFQNEDSPEFLTFMVATQYSQLTLFFAGSIFENHINVLERCLEHLGRLQFDALVIDLFGVKAVDIPGAKAFDSFMRQIEDAGVRLMVSSLRTEIREVMVENGVCLPEGLSSDVSGAVRVLGFRRVSDMPTTEVPSEAAKPAAAAPEPQEKASDTPAGEGAGGTSSAA